MNKVKLIERNHKSVHFLNWLSIYWHFYMNTVTTEYWAACGGIGKRRRKILELGKFTVWVSEPQLTKE